MTSPPVDLDLLYPGVETWAVLMHLPEHLLDFARRHPEDIRHALSAAQVQARRRDLERLRASGGARGIRTARADRDRLRQLIDAASAGDRGVLQVLHLGPTR